MAVLISAPVLFQALLAFLCVLQSTAKYVSQGNVTIDTPVGKVRGQSLVLTDDNNESPFYPFYVFRGIPYAKPPVGELRFKPTEPLEPWEGTYDALATPSACLQYAENPFPWYDTLPGQSEDCLYLNVFTPKAAVTGYKDGNEVEKRAVKLYIHGGGWFTGGSNRMGYYKGHGDANDLDSTVESDLIQFVGLVVVTINYRLGALGFLSSGTDDAPGNAGLHDIFTALKWVHSNIASFGGDPDNIVLFGQGAGAIAASLFLTAPSALPLFKKLVISGATPYTLKALKGVTDEYGDGSENNVKLADRLAKAVGCSSSIAENPKDTVDWLKGVEATSLVKTLASFSPIFQQPPNAFLPQFGRDQLLPFRDPFEILGRSNNYDKKDAFLAFTADEGSYLLTVNNPDVFGVFGEKDAAIDEVQAKSMMTKFLENFPQTDDLAEKLLGDLDRKPTVANRKRVYQVMGHVNTICPIVYFADNLANDGNTVYVQEKEVDPPYNPWAKWMGSVHFSNVQLDFLHEVMPYGVPLVINGKSYNVTHDQSEISFLNKVVAARFIYGEIKDGDLFFRKYTSKGRHYSIFSKDPKKSVTRSDPTYDFLFKNRDNRRVRSNLGGKFCEILKKYFVK